MKKYLLILISALMLTACGVGNYSTSSGKSDTCLLSFTYSTDVKEMPLTVYVDGQSHDIQAVKQSAFKKKKDLKATAANSIRLEAGTHDVKVVSAGQEIFAKKLVISASEHRVIEL